MILNVYIIMLFYNVKLKMRYALIIIEQTILGPNYHLHRSFRANLTDLSITVLILSDVFDKNKHLLK